MYIMGENPAMSDPDVDHAREALAALEHLVVQDIFLTETAYLADVVLPATAWPEKIGTVTNTDRMVQLGRKAVEPPGDAREDLWIIQELARRMGLDWKYAHPREVFDEMRKCMDSIAGITWERLERDSSVTYPCENEGDPGQPVVFTEHFPTATGRAQVRAGGHHPRRRAARRRVPAGADHRPPARALAHRRDDAPRRRARRDRAGAGREHPSARSRAAAGRRRARWSPSSRGAARSRSTRASTRARRRARYSSRSATTRRRRTSSPTRRSTRSARFRSSSTARCACGAAARYRGRRATAAGRRRCPRSA